MIVDQYRQVIMVADLQLPPLPLTKLHAHTHAQKHMSRPRQYRSLGLGLFLSVKEAARLHHGGKIWISAESIRPGEKNYMRKIHLC